MMAERGPGDHSNVPDSANFFSELTADNYV
jgi:hypothetical protein